MKRIKLWKYKYLGKKYGNANDKNMNFVEEIRRWENWFGISNYKARSNVKKMGNIMGMGIVRISLYKNIKKLW